MSNPFPAPVSKPGHGTVHLVLLPPSTPVLQTVQYQYPVKLISPTALRSASNDLVHTVYLLTYGGGIVAGDSIDLNVLLDAGTKLILLTQGSTKIFKSPTADVISRQSTIVDLAPGSALCYLPDPVQPFERSCFEQRQIYNVLLPSTASASSASTGSLCVLDWVSSGRPALGEKWSLTRYGSRNEIWLAAEDGKKRLLLRDNILLDSATGAVAVRMDEMAVFGTLMLYGPLVASLGKFFMAEFGLLPRIGGRKWDSGSESGDEEVDPTVTRRLQRQAMEREDGLLWTAASVRGCAVVKFGARDVEGGRKWLRAMLKEEGSVEREFGQRALLCL